MKQAHFNRFDRKTDSFADLSSYSFKQRSMIRIADLIFYLLIRIIGRSVRFTVEGMEFHDKIYECGQVPIMTIWHNRILMATYYFRERGIVVMTSQSFDGEYIARFIQRFGYGAARGSSTRGGAGALVELIRMIKARRPVGFSIDGPRGPRYVAKMGAVLLAKKTGQPILPFTINAKRYLNIKSWDRLQIPVPFTSAQVRIAEPIWVAPDADETELQSKLLMLQKSLDYINSD